MTESAQNTVAAVLAKHLYDKWKQQFPQISFMLHPNRDGSVVEAESLSGQWLEIAFEDDQCVLYDSMDVGHLYRVPYGDTDLEQQLSQLIQDKMVR